MTTKKGSEVWRLAGPVCLATLILDAIGDLSFFGSCSLVARSLGVSEDAGAHLMAVDLDPADNHRIIIEVLAGSADPFRDCVFFVAGSACEKWGGIWKLTMSLPPLDKPLISRLLRSWQRDTREWTIRRIIPVVAAIGKGDLTEG